MMDLPRAFRFQPAVRGLAFLLAAAALVLPARPAAAEDAGGKKDSPGKLNDLAPITRRLLPMTVDGGLLKLDRDAWSRPLEGKSGDDLKSEFKALLVKQGLPEEWAARQADEMAGAADVERLFGGLQKASRSHGSSRSHGGTERSMSFRGGGLAAKLTLSKETVTIELREEEQAKRSLEVFDDGAGALRLVAAAADGSFTLVLQQATDGRFSVALVEGDAPFAGTGASYPAFYRAHRAVVEGRLLPLLTALGVGSPPTADSPAVRQAVLDRLRPPAAAERERVEEAIAQLDDANQAAREAATQQLVACGHRHRALIEATLKQPDITPEAASRLKRVLAKTVARRRAAELAEALDLAADPATLVKLLAEATEADRPAVAAALEKITGRSFGADVAAWTRWLEKRE